MNTVEYHDLTLADIKEHEVALAELADNERYINGSGYNFEDYLDEIDKNYWTGERVDGKRWSCGTSLETPEIKALQKIFRRVCREMKQ
jgi:hypothetical protein